MDCKLLKQGVHKDCTSCSHFVYPSNLDDCEDGYCDNSNEDDFEEDSYERTY